MRPYQPIVTAYYAAYATAQSTKRAASGYQAAIRDSFYARARLECTAAQTAAAASDDPPHLRRVSSSNAREDRIPHITIHIPIFLPRQHNTAVLRIATPERC
jgi:hypothetical protein